MAETEEPTIGSIKWEIVETATSQILSSGEKTLHLRDIKITLNQELYSKQVELSSDFTFALCDKAEDKIANKGFGLTGDRRGDNTFGWDWFEVKIPGHANKLQESGELSFDTKKTKNGVEIYRMEFLTDVSIRVSRMTDPDPLNPRFRINVSKGSFIYWPFLENGEVKCLAIAPPEK